VERRKNTLHETHPPARASDIRVEAPHGAGPADEDSLASFGSETHPPPAAVTRANVERFPIDSSDGDQFPIPTAYRASPPAIRSPIGWLRQPSPSISPVWLFVVAIGAASAGAGYVFYMRPVPVRPSPPAVIERQTAPDADGNAPSVAATAPPSAAPPKAMEAPRVPPINTPPRSNAAVILRAPSESRPTTGDARTLPPGAVDHPRTTDGDPSAAIHEGLAPTALASLPRVPAVHPAAPATPPAPPAREESETVRDQRVIRSLLEAYREAYGRLDPLAVAALWPGVDTRALTRAFSALNHQQMTFDRCDITITGAVAVARCDGSLSYTRRIGESEVQSRQMSWAFALERASGQWRISGINSR
jgi:hypothetical protein